MDEISIPPRANGKVGMVAQLRRVRQQDVGKLVAVRLPLGRMSSLTESLMPVFAWQVLVLGEPVDLNGKACREIIVADRCLKPVSQLDPGVVDALALRRAEQDADETLADLRRILAANPLTPLELDDFIDKAAEQFGMARLLEVVPPAVALQELDFRPTGSGEDSGWQWSGMHKGSELHIVAGPDLFGRWMFAGRNVTARHAMFDERVLADKEPRGKVALLVLELWREAFGSDAPVPGSLQPALAYELHLEEMRSLEIGLPTLRVDGEVLRAIRRWLHQRHRQPADEVGPPPDQPLSMAFDNGLLRLDAGGQAFGCPADGVWVGDCQVSLREFLAIPPWRLRGWHIKLERSAEVVSLNGDPLRIAPGLTQPVPEPQRP